ncbi:unnamed protein product, partial [Closterium sp. NIES-53]
MLPRSFNNTRKILPVSSSIPQDKYKHDRGPSWSLLVLACALTAIVSSLAGSYTSYALTRNSLQFTDISIAAYSSNSFDPTAGLSTVTPPAVTTAGKAVVESAVTHSSEARGNQRAEDDSVPLYSPKASLLSRYADLIGPSNRGRDAGAGSGNRGGNNEPEWIRLLVESAKVNSSRSGQQRPSTVPLTAVNGGQKQNESMVVLVTGAAGFIGSHLALALKKEGHGVVGLDNFNDYYDTTLKEARAARLWSAGIEIIRGDLNNGTLLDALFATVTFTHVAHMAAQAGVRYALENPKSYVDSNVAGFVNLLERCRRVPERQPAIVWASSSSVYGVNREVPFSESHRTERPASLYAATKLAGEAIAHSYNHIHGLSLTALRFFTVYGPWGRPDMAYFFFTKNILEKKAIEVYMGTNGACLFFPHPSRLLFPTQGFHIPPFLPHPSPSPSFPPHPLPPPTPRHPHPPFLYASEVTLELPSPLILQCPHRSPPPAPLLPPPLNPVSPSPTLPTTSLSVPPIAPCHPYAPLLSPPCLASSLSSCIFVLVLPLISQL